MKVSVRLFAMLRERAGADSVELDLPDDATVADAIAALGRDPEVGDLAARLPLRIAVNREYMPADAPIAAGRRARRYPARLGRGAGGRRPGAPGGRDR